MLSLFSGVCLAVRLMNDLWAEWRASAVFSKHLSTPADWRSLCRVPDRFRSSWCRSGSNQMCLFKELKEFQRVQISFPKLALSIEDAFVDETVPGYLSSTLNKLISKDRIIIRWSVH